MAMSDNTNVTETILGVSGQWANAERYGDTDMLAKLLTDDFVGVGPRGFTLAKQAWMDRHSSGALRHDTFSWDNVQARTYGDDAAIVIGMTESKGSWAGQPISGKSRVTQILVRADGGGWVIAGMHLSQIADLGARPSATVVRKWLWRSFRDVVSRRIGRGGGVAPRG
jgi:ketosteroid isomerase-like protein